MNLFSIKQEDQRLLIEQRLTDIASSKPVSRSTKSRSRAVKDLIIPGYINRPSLAGIDLGFSKWGAAMAHNLVAEVYSATRLIYEDISALDWEIVVNVDEEDKVLASRTDRHSTNKLANAISNWEVTPGVRSNLFEYMAMDYLLYGQTVTELVGSVFDQGRIEHAGLDIGFGRTLERLNPLGIGLQTIFGGTIDHITYGWEGAYVQLSLDDVAYDIFPNSLSDIEGHSPTMSAMMKINIVRNFDRYIRAFFANDGRPGMVVMPKVDAVGRGEMSQGQYDRIKTVINNNFKGVENAFNTYVLQSALDIQVLEKPNTSKQSQEQAQVVDAIYESFRVARAMLGNTSNTPYKDGDETTRRHFLGTVLPLSRIIATNVNNSIMPFFDPSGQQLFQFVTDKFDEISAADQRRATVLDMQTKGTLVDLWTASNDQGFKPPKELREMYMMPSGDIIHQSEIRTYWKEKAAMAAGPPGGDMGGMPPPPGDMPAPPEDDLIDWGVETDDPLADEEPIKSACSCSSCKTAWNYVAQLYNGDDLYPDEVVIEERINKELKAWVKFEKRVYGKKSTHSFAPKIVPLEYVYAIRDRLGAVTDLTQISTAIYDVFEDEAIKTIQSYRRNLRAASRRLWRGLISKSEFVSRINRAIDSEFTKAFNAGVKRSGIAVSDLTHAQKSKLTSFIGEERSHVPNLADYIVSVNKDVGGKLSTVRSRVELWPSRVPEIEEVGFLTGSGTKRLKWIYNPAKEHCGDCEFLNGRVYTAEVWNNTGIHPRSRKLSCFGLRCGCGWKETTDSFTLGRPPSVFGKRKAMELDLKAFSEANVNRSEGGQFSSSGGGGGGSSDSDKPEEDKPEEDKPEDSTSTEGKVEPSKHPVLVKSGNADAAQEILGKDFSPEQMASLAGMGSDIPVNPGEIWMTTEGKGTRIVMRGGDEDSVRMDRHFFKDSDGKLVAKNKEFFINEDLQGQGLGTKIFNGQVKELRNAGFDRIEAHAGKSENMNGYYTWARLGYDAPLPPSFEQRKLNAPVNSPLRQAKRVSDYMRTQEGREFWSNHGVGINMTFDLTEGSQSNRILDAYTRERGIKSALKQNDPTPQQKGVENPPEMTPEDEAILDKIWDEMNKSIKAFDESKHPRGEGGQFGSGDSSSSSDSDKPEDSDKPKEDKPEVEEESLDNSPEAGTISNAGTEFIARDKVRDQRKAYEGSFDKVLENNWKRELSPGESEAMAEWSGSTGYDDFQAMARGDYEPPDTGGGGPLSGLPNRRELAALEATAPEGTIEERFANFEAAVDRAPKYEGLSWRGATNRNMNADEVLEGYRSNMGGNMEFDTYSSASGDSARGVNFSQAHSETGTPVMYEIHSKQGRYTNSSSNLAGAGIGHNLDERELIFQPGANFTIRDAYMGQGLNTNGRERDAVIVVLEDV